MTFYFYDLETTSGSARTGRIMQFAGQRTDAKLQPIAEPDNILIRLSDDVIPEPDAILIHKITPQQANTDGISEATFCQYFDEHIATADTVFVGFNNIRFDDEFMRRILYRNFYDPYHWHWKDGRSRWDLLDPIRMMRALRPEGLVWPEIDGKPTVKLELLAKENGLTHDSAHDALSDVQALIELAQKFQKAQPKLFAYLLQARSKNYVADIAKNPSPFVYTSGKYPSEYEKTTLVSTLFAHPRREAAIVYDLRHDPDEWKDKSVDDLVKHWTVRYGDELPPLPVKTMQFNRCPAIAPMSVIDAPSQARINLDLEQALLYAKKLATDTSLIEKLIQALDIIEDAQQTRMQLDAPVDEQLYDEFWSTQDQRELQLVRAAEPTELSKLSSEIKNKRMRALLPLYKARNYPELLTTEERAEWEAYRYRQLVGSGEKGRLAKFFARMQELGKKQLSTDQEYLLTELQLYVESILPEPSDDQTAS